MSSYNKTSEKYLGKTFSSKNHGDFIVLDYENCANVTVKFVDTGTVVLTTTTYIANGATRDPSVKKLKKSSKCKYLGNVYSSNNYGDYIVEAAIGVDKIRIKFLNTGNIQEIFRVQVRTKSVRDYSVAKVMKLRTKAKLIRTVGNSGGDKTLIKENIQIYQTWCAMLQRCYTPTTQYVKDAYEGCTVSENFKDFPYFLNWWLKECKKGGINLHLDKDILVKGNRLYSEDTCTLVPREINLLCIKRKKARGELPIGVTFCKQSAKYKAQFSKHNKIVNLGLHTTPDLAFQAYKEAKEIHVKNMANFYKEVISNEVYDALMKYEVNIDD